MADIDIFSLQPSKIIYKALLSDLRDNFKVINDSEKICDVVKKDDETDQYSNVYEINLK